MKAVVAPTGSARSRQRSGNLALNVLKFALAGCVLAFAGVVGSLLWRMFGG